MTKQHNYHKIILTLLIILSIGTMSTSIYLCQKTQIIKNISPQEAFTLIQIHKRTCPVHKHHPNFVILDLRSPAEYKTWHVENAINLDYSSETFEDKLNNLNKNKTYLIYSDCGGRGMIVLSMMQDLGFKSIYNMIGGFNYWMETGGGMPPAKIHLSPKKHF